MKANEQGFAAMPADKRDAVLCAGLDAFTAAAYGEVATEEITRAAGISKGLLFHYFGSKQSFYGALLRHALDRLCGEAWPCLQREGELAVIGTLRGVFDVCERYPRETTLLNRAARENAAVPRMICKQVWAEYALRLAPRMDALMNAALTGLPLRDGIPPQRAARLLLTHLRALTNEALGAYVDDIHAFFAHGEELLAAWNEELWLLVYGIAVTEKKEGNIE